MFHSHGYSVVIVNVGGAGANADTIPSRRGVSSVGEKSGQKFLCYSVFSL